MRTKEQGLGQAGCGSIRGSAFRSFRLVFFFCFLLHFVGGDPVFDYLFAGDDVFHAWPFVPSGGEGYRPARLLYFLLVARSTLPQYMYTRSDIRRALRVREKKKQAQAALML